MKKRTVLLCAIPLVAFLGCYSVKKGSHQKLSEPIQGQGSDLAVAKMLKAADARRPGAGYVEHLPVRREFTQEFTKDDLTIEMVYVPGGKVLLESVRGDRGDEPKREVLVPAFWMSKYELTWDVFWWWYSERNLARDETDIAHLHPSGFDLSAFLEDGTLENIPMAPLHAVGNRELLEQMSCPGAFRRVPDAAGREPSVGSNRPIVGLTQYGAQQMCRWMSLRTGRMYRLPTEGEWEFAATAGDQSLHRHGEEVRRLSEYAWFGEEYQTGPHAVGLKKPNAFGLRDMYGNVSEYCLDGWPENNAPLSEQRGASWVRRSRTSPYSVVRGGNWTSDAQEVRRRARARIDESLPIDFELFAGWYNLTTDGLKVGIRIVSPVVPDRDGRDRYLANYATDLPLR